MHAWNSLTQFASASSRFASACRWCAAHRHECAAAGALLTCFAIVLNVCSLSKAPERQGPKAAAEQASSLLARSQIDGGERLDRFQWKTDAIEVAEQTNPLTDLLAIPTDAFARKIFLPVAPKLADADVQPAAMQQDAPDSPPLAAIAGVWVPDAGACSAQSFRAGLLPTIINAEGAWAGETFCMFKNARATDTGWRVAASCSNAREHWTTDVRLSLKDDRLTWASKRGTQAYTRCAPDFMMASR
jgi:hypothetical protein